MKKRILVLIKWLALAVWILAAGFCCSCSTQEEELLLSDEASWNAESEEPDAETMEVTTEPVCMVHVCGQVVNPGVYELKSGQRIFEAIELAGGFTECAADDYLNLAQLVSDGMKIEVPDRKRAQELSEMMDVTGSSDSRIDLNTATKAQLMTLSGIGETRAEAILAYRQEHGPFQKIEDIMLVSGIKDSAFQKIKEEITVGP